jgi:cytochrome c peroxidase
MLTRHAVRVGILVCIAALAGPLLVSRGATAADGEGKAPNMFPFDNASGVLRTFNTAGPIDLLNPFFGDLGTNGRSCFTCHQPQDAWTITPANVQARFAQSKGRDPIFRSNDGSNCEGAPKVTQRAYSLLLTRGLIRVGIDVPIDAEFVIDSVKDPYDCHAPLTQASMYRRPLPSTNLKFVSAVMWDGRESSPARTIREDLLHQSNEATIGHAQASLALTDEERRQIVDFELGLFTTQARDNDAGSLHAHNAAGGPVALSEQPFFIGINDPVGLDPTGTAFTPSAFTLFDEWAGLKHPGDDGVARARRRIARGQQIFNTRTFTISGVPGLNGQTFSNGVTVPASLTGTCTICHDSPNAGNHSVKAPLNIGVADPAKAPYLPVYTLRNRNSGETVTTTDPGRAMITGKWADVGKFKGPVLRALAARAPYFHNGAAASLEEAIDFYEERFSIGLTRAEKADLAAFLRSL